MHTWLAEATQWVNVYLGSPGNSTQTVTVIIAAGLTMGFVMVVAGTAVGMSAVGSARKLLGLVVGVIVLLAAVSATSLWMPGWVRDPTLRLGLMVGIPVAATLFVVLPLMAWITKGRYVEVFLSFLMCIFAGFVMAQVVLAVSGSLRGGKKETFFLKGRRDSMNRFLNEKQ